MFVFMYLTLNTQKPSLKSGMKIIKQHIFIYILFIYLQRVYNLMVICYE